MKLNIVENLKIIFLLDSNEVKRNKIAKYIIGKLEIFKWINNNDISQVLNKRLEMKQIVKGIYSSHHVLISF